MVLVRGGHSVRGPQMRYSTEVERLGRLGRRLIWLSLPVLLWLYFGSDAGWLPPLGSLGAEWSRLRALFASPLVDGWLLARYMAQSYALTFLIIMLDLLFGLALLRMLRKGRPSRLSTIDSSPR